MSAESLLGDASGYAGRKLALLLPWYKSTNPLTAFSIFSVLDRTKMSVLLNFGDAFVAHTRNKLACAFLKTGLEWSLSIDDDMIIPCGNSRWFNSHTGFNLPDKFAGLNTVTRLLSHRKTLVGALYFGRWKNGRAIYGEGFSRGKEEAYARGAPYDICKPTRWVGSGCTLIHRSVFLDIEKEFPHLARDSAGEHGHWFTSSEHDLKDSVRAAAELLADPNMPQDVRIDEAKKLLADAENLSARNSSLGMGEDVTFCVRAAQAGHQPHVDMGLICGHIGHHVFGPRA